MSTSKMKRIQGYKRISQIVCNNSCGSRADMSIVLKIPKPHSVVWDTVGDIPNFLCIDPFHVKISVIGNRIQAGARIILHHLAFGVAFIRLGKILYFNEGKGYAFSDISRRGSQKGFPHVFYITVRPYDKLSTTLIVRVRGKWKTTRLSKPLRNLWLHYVCKQHVRLLRKAFSFSHN